MDTFECIKFINEDIFTLNDLYGFEKYLKNKHPRNNHVKDKIRQQLQFLRNEGYIEFLGNGKYKKIK